MLVSYSHLQLLLTYDAQFPHLIVMCRISPTLIDKLDTQNLAMQNHQVRNLPYCAPGFPGPIIYWSKNKSQAFLQMQVKWHNLERELLAMYNPHSAV